MEFHAAASKSGSVPVTRTEPGLVAGERATLLGFLNYQRATVLLKAEGLNQTQLARTPAASSLCLAGLLKHLWRVEDTWVKIRFLGLDEPEPWASDTGDDVDWDLNSAADDDPDWLRDGYRRACETNDALIGGRELDELTARPTGDGDYWNLRWILVHLIEETARHAGHADLLREAIDGTVGE